MDVLARLARALAVGMLATLAARGAAAEEKPAIDEVLNCLDGGQPYRVGAHLCSSEHIVRICLRPNQSYGVHGVYVYVGRDKGGLRFEKAHWVSIDSGRCAKSDRGRVYY
jgi:hypothetical protein